MPDTGLPHQWPYTTGLQDFMDTTTPEEVHGVALGLGKGLRGYSASVYEQLPLDHPRPKWWQRWVPGCSAPDWWVVRDASGAALHLVHVAPPEEGGSLGYLWLHAHTTGRPLLYLPDHHLQPAVWVTPDPGIGMTYENESEARRLVTAINRAPWPGPFRQLDAADPGTFQTVFGGFFTVGDHHFDQFQCMALIGAPVVPGFPKRVSGGGGLSLGVERIRFQPPR